MPRRDRRADAHQSAREIKNRIHQYEQETVLPLRAQIAQLERDNKAMSARLQRSERLEALYNEALSVSVRLASTLLATGKDSE